MVPGSQVISKIAEEKGLDKIYTDAGFEWRGAGCSMCLAMNPDKLVVFSYVLVLANHTLSVVRVARRPHSFHEPLTVAAAAIKGHVADAREVFDV